MVPLLSDGDSQRMCVALFMLNLIYVPSFIVGVNTCVHRDMSNRRMRAASTATRDDLVAFHVLRDFLLVLTMFRVLAHASNPYPSCCIDWVDVVLPVLSSAVRAIVALMWDVSSPCVVRLFVFWDIIM